MDTIMRATIRALVKHAYEQGWSDACGDHLAQQQNADVPIGQGKAPGVDDVLLTLDPHDLLGLRGAS